MIYFRYLYLADKLTDNSSYMNLPFKPKFLWVDLEMSGLDPKTNEILEFACILTDEHLKYEQEGPHIIIHADQ